VTRPRHTAPPHGVPVIDLAAERKRRAKERQRQHIAAATCVDLAGSLAASLQTSEHRCGLCLRPWREHDAQEIERHAAELREMAENPSPPIGA
jgi:hypothetical protein